MSDCSIQASLKRGALLTLLSALVSGCAALPFGSTDAPIPQWKEQGAERISDTSARDLFFDYLVRADDGELAHSFMLQTDPDYRSRYFAARDAGIASRDGSKVIQALRARGYTGDRKRFYSLINLRAQGSAPHYNQSGRYFSFRKSIPHIIEQNEKAQNAWDSSGQRPPLNWPSVFKFKTNTRTEIRVFRDQQTAASIIARFQNPSFRMHTNFGLLYEIEACSRVPTAIECEVRLVDQVVFANGRTVNRGTPEADATDAVIFASQR